MLKLTVALVTLALTGCSAESASYLAEGGPEPAPSSVMVRMDGMPTSKMESMPAEGGQLNVPQTQQKYVAERQSWTFELPQSQVESRWKKHMALCVDGCEVVNAAVSKSSQATSSAWLELRVEREKAQALLAAMDDPDLVVERNVSREDKTIEVVDTDAKMANRIELRSRLRNLLATHTGKLPDLLQLEQELSRVQGEIDSATSIRRVLALETEKIFVHVDYRPKPSIAETGAMRPLVEAWQRAGRTFAVSAGVVLSSMVSVIPWMVVVLPTVLAGFAIRRKWRRKKEA